jgi:hypothetical protein
MFANYDRILNPEFLSVLNPRTGPIKILFHANDVKVDFYEYEAAIPADFAQFICARRITLHTTLIDRNNILKFIMGTGNALEKICIDSYESTQGEFCEFLVKVNFEIHFYNFQI